MTILLAGDTGGTKTSLSLVKSQSRTHSLQPPQQESLFEQTYRSQDFPDLVPLVTHFWADAHQALGELPTVEAACFGIAGPVINDTSELTNLKWSLSASQLEHDLKIPKVSLINDFAAIGHGVLGLPPTDLHTLQLGDYDPQAPIAVIGAGTGLGESFLIPNNTGYRVFSSEGSHADYPADSELTFQMVRYLQEKYAIDRISIERIVSGMGIVAIYQFLRNRDLAQESPELAEVFRIWDKELGQQEKTVDPAAEISKRAIAQADYLCQQTMDIFIRSYGIEAGNFALKLMPFGGLYVAGGIAPKILPLLTQGEFMEGFLRKGRMSALMRRIPVHIVLNPKVGLIGAGIHAAHLI